MNTRQQWILSWINARPADCTCCCSREFSLKSVHVGLSTASLYTPRLPGALTAPSMIDRSPWFSSFARIAIAVMRFRSSTSPAE